MQAIIEFFKKKWVIQLLGIIALSIIIWFVGPLIAIAGAVPLESEIVRGGVLLFIFLLWIILLLLQQVKANKTEQQMMEGIVQADTTGDQSAEELQLLKERFDEALGVLKKSGKGGMASGSQYLYELPWYIIIGPPGSGKTTALINSGLNFPLSEKFGGDAIRGVGGTRNCDWWFTENAVLLDTAGRYTTQDSHEAVDSSAWLGFLDLLKKHRKRRPINGIIIAISLSDLMLQSEEERSQHARAIRSRIEELNERLGIQAPIYMNFTKADLVAGFTEFFDDLGREDRNQVWGSTLQLESKAGVETIPSEFDALLNRLNERVLWRMQQERDIQRRTLIHGFPLEMASLKQPICQFLDEAFRPNRYQDAPHLRGIYFTSGTQEGTPIDRLMGNLAANFGLNRASLAAFSGRGRSYFIHDLFTRVLFPEANLVGSDQKVERRRAWLQRSTYIGALGLTILTALGWTTSFTTNQLNIGGLEERVTEYQQSVSELPYQTTDFATLLKPLDDLRQAAGHYNPDDVPLTMGLGLYQGDKLDPAANAAYLRLLQGRFLYSLGARLEQQLQHSSHPELLLEALKAYLMLGQPEHLQVDNLKLFMSVDWSNTLAGESEQQNRLLSHLESLLASRFTPLPLNQNIVRQARHILTAVPMSRQLYARIQQQATAKRDLDFLLSNTLGRNGGELFSYKGGPLEQGRIPALYTYKGFYQIFLPEGQRLAEEILSERWVYQNDAGTSQASDVELSKLITELKEIYIDDYINIWRQMLNNLKIVKLNNLSQSVEMLDIASSPTSPLRKLLLAVKVNTTLSTLPEEKGSQPIGEGKLASAAGSLGTALNLGRESDYQKRRLRALMSAANTISEDGQTVGVKDPLLSQVEESFDKLNQLMKKEGDAPMPLEGLIKDLGDLMNYLADLDAVGGSAALAAAKQRVAGTSKDPLKRLQRRTKRLPKPLKEWIFAMADRGWGTVVKSTRTELSVIWRADVLPLCKSSIQGRYPIVSGSQNEVTLADFARFFGPGQIMDTFFNEQIKPFANTSKRPWRWRKAGGHPVGISTANLRQFERAAQIRDVFFSAGAKKPSITFNMKPTHLASTIKRVVLDIDGQKLTYRHGPSRSTKMVWPPTNASGKAQISFEDLNGKIHIQKKEGVWSWFRLLGTADIKSKSQADRFEVTFKQGGQTARFELQASSVTNPFRLPELEQFRCPAL
ncbi:MAG: type VI secretion system membrane subunit TssM [Candidatus Polarisedimenticolaceae bacterium]|nr:type VI secretion system membrane subunit TssM [Candidatus Polarisedimenticolaceae bacterium]